LARARGGDFQAVFRICEDEAALQHGLRTIRHSRAALFRGMPVNCEGIESVVGTPRSHIHRQEHE